MAITELFETLNLLLLMVGRTWLKGICIARMEAARSPNINIKEKSECGHPDIIAILDAVLNVLWKFSMKICYIRRILDHMFYSYS